MSDLRKILRKPEVRKATGLSGSQIWRKANDPNDEFPSSLSLGPNSTGWYADEIIAWQESRPRGGGEQKPHLAAHYGRGAKTPAQAEEAAFTCTPNAA